MRLACDYLTNTIEIPKNCKDWFIADIRTWPFAVTSTSFLKVDFSVIFPTTKLPGRRPVTIDLSKRWSAAPVHRLVRRASVPCDTHFGVGARNLNGSLFSKLADWSPTTSGLPARVNFRTPVPSLKSILSSFTHRAPGLLVSW